MAKTRPDRQRAGSAEIRVLHLSSFFFANFLGELFPGIGFWSAMDLHVLLSVFYPTDKADVWPAIFRRIASTLVTINIHGGKLE
jgi:hypothetical protein